MANTTVKVSFIGDAKDLNRAIDDVDGKVSGFSTKLGALAKAAAGAFVVKELGDAVFASAKAFAEDEKAAASLAKTLENTVGATKAQVDATEKFINKTQNASGVLDDKLRPALETLIRGTGDLTKAQKLLGLAMDISAGTGKDLGSVTEALSKAANGNFKALKALDPALNDLIKDGASTDDIMSALAKTFEGQTAVAADTTAGKIAIAKARFSDLQEEIGAKVVPILAKLAEIISEQVIPTIEAIVGWLEEHKAVAIAIAVVIGGALVVAFVAWAVAAASAAAATFAAISPILAVVAAIGLLVAGVIYAYTHWGWFHDAVDAVARFLRDDLWPALQAIWRVIHDDIIPVIAGVTVAFWRFVVDVKDVVKDVIEAFGGIAEGIYAPFKWAFDKIKDIYDKSIGPIIGAIKGIAGGVGGAIGHIPGFASGGVVPGPVGAPMLAVVHGGETVTPNGGGGGGQPIIVYAQFDGRTFATFMTDYSRDIGGLPLTLRSPS